jgi:hypothetical protein
MNTEHDYRTRIVLSWLREDAHENAERMLLRALDEVDATPQRRSWWPARRSNRMNTYAKLIVAAAAVLVVAVIGYQLLPRAGGTGGQPGPPTVLDGTVHYRLDGAAATTEVDAVADGASVSGTAVSTFDFRGTHTVRLECAARDGDTWALGGTVDETSYPGERAGGWSAVIVKDGSPQRIGIWLSDTKSEGIDCAGWLSSIDLADIGPENFQPVESGALVPPPDLAP